MLGSLFRKESLVGLDIGSATIKAVQVEPHRFGYRVVRAAQHPTPLRSVRDGVVTEKEAVTEAIQELLAAGKINATGAVLAISGPAVSVRQVRLPHMPDASLRKTIRYEASKFVTTNIEEAALAYEVIGPSEVEAGMDEVMLVAAPNEVVDSRVKVVNAAGLDAVAVDLEAFSLLRSVFEMDSETVREGALQALVDIGASHTEVTILNNGAFGLTRSIPIGGTNFTDAIQNHLRVERAEAEGRKIQADLGALINGTSTPADIELLRGLQGSLDEMLREVRRSINYYQSQLPEASSAVQVAEIVLVGGGALLRGLVPYVHARLGIEARVASPFDAPYIDAEPEAIAWLQEQGPQLGIALGLSLKEHLLASKKPVASTPSGKSLFKKKAA